MLPGLAEALQAAPISRREDQLLRMGHAALAEVLEALPDGVEVPLLLGLPSTTATRPIDPAGFLQRLRQQAALRSTWPAASRCRAAGRPA